MSGAGEFAIQRHQRILDELRRTGAVRVSELAIVLDVAELTIRRDIAQLADRGLLTRVHGGATVRSPLDERQPRVGVRPVSAARYRLGLVVPSLSYYWPQVVVGARAAAAEQGVQLVLRGASYLAGDQRRQIASLIESGAIHGLIAAPENLGPDGYALLTWLESLSIPVVMVERRAPSMLALSKLEWVTTDHVFGGGLAARHLASLGHRRLGIMTSAQSPTSWQLRRGWARALEEEGLTGTIDVNASLDYMTGEERAEYVTALLDEAAASKTTAMLIHSDPQALLVQQYATDRGIRVPDDLAIIAYDDEVAENGAPPITALRPPKADVGRRAVETLVARLDAGGRNPVERVHLLPTLHVRESTQAK